MQFFIVIFLFYFYFNLTFKPRSSSFNKSYWQTQLFAGKALKSELNLN